MAVVWPNPDAFYILMVGAIFGLISCFSTPIAILAYLKSTSIRKAHQNLLLLALLVNALVYSLSTTIINISMLLVKNSDILAIQWVCNIDGFIKIFCTNMEIYILMCISVERYFSITRQISLTFNQIVGMIAFGVCLMGLVFR
jgi:hypothetical protein